MRCGLGPAPGACSASATVVLRSGGALIVLACEPHGRGAVGAVPGALVRDVGQRQSHGRPRDIGAWPVTLPPWPVRAAVSPARAPDTPRSRWLTWENRAK